MNLLLVSPQLIKSRKAISSIVSAPRDRAIAVLAEVDGSHMTVQVAGPGEFLVAKIPETEMLLKRPLELREGVHRREMNRFPVV